MSYLNLLDINGLPKDGRWWLQEADKRAARDSAITDIVVPATLRDGTPLDLLVNGAVSLSRSNVRWLFLGSRITKTLASPYSCFVAAAPGRPYYGGSVRDVVFDGPRFFYSGVTLAGFSLHHAAGFTLRHGDFDGTQGRGHSLDLAGCEDVVIEDTEWRGYRTPDGFPRLTDECVQVDLSGRGSIPVGDEGSWSGLGSRRVTVERSRFLPLTTPEGVTYPCPNPIGSHAPRLGMTYDDVTFNDNDVVDPAVGRWASPTAPRFDEGPIHLVHSRRLRVTANRFKRTVPKAGLVVNLAAMTSGPISEPNANPAVNGPFPVPIVAEDFVELGNSYENFVGPVVRVEGRSDALAGVTTDRLASPLLY